MELVTAISLLVMIILGVSVIFRSSSKAVSLSQATMETFANVRAVQQQIERDVAGMDRDGFLVIRSQITPTGNRRVDQVAFVAKGAFPNRTGTMTANTFADNTVANAAVIWLGHGVVEGDGTTPMHGDGPIIDPAQQGNGVALGAMPSGTKDQEFTLLRHATLLMAKNGSGSGITTTSGTIAAYDNPSINAPSVSCSEGAMAHICSSRVAVCSLTPSQLMQGIIKGINDLGGRGSAARYEADSYCFRFKYLPNPYAGDVTGTYMVVNGAYRMHPILLQGVADFKVEWTDGTTNATGLVWYGRDLPKGTDAIIEPAVANNDVYTAQFSFDKKGSWPKALKFTYRVTDPMDRLNGGRVFTQVVKVPD